MCPCLQTKGQEEILRGTATIQIVYKVYFVKNMQLEVDTCKDEMYTFDAQ